ncbi:metalloregulator ArsR/SmtB family transcription factor [Kribbella sp. NPDC003505]|uniref:ArsR/SmtB family transcription factor n=1 Tax=Kribbella sp. NPDC003505 TaxID=3154448 RepID=UPI0033BB400D
MPHARRPALTHPDVAEVELVQVLHALADPTRLTIVRTLRRDVERPCGTFPVTVAPSTLSHHFRVLRDAGLIHQREDGNRRWTTLRHGDLETRFPGLIDAVLRAEDGSERPRLAEGCSSG